MCAATTRVAVCVVRIETTDDGLVVTLRITPDVERQGAETVVRTTDVEQALDRLRRMLTDFAADEQDRRGR